MWQGINNTGVTTNRNVGIKNSNPFYPLDVNGRTHCYSAFVDSMLQTWFVKTEHLETDVLQVNNIATVNELSVNGLTTLNTVILNDGVTIPPFAGNGSGLIKYNNNGSISRLTFTNYTNDVLTGDGTFHNITSLTGWDWSGNDIYTNRNVKIARNLIVDSSITALKTSSQEITAGILQVGGATTLQNLTLTGAMQLTLFAGTKEGLLKYNTSGQLGRLDFINDSNTVLTGGGIFKNIGSMVAPYTGWQWYDTTVLLSTAPVVAIQNNLAVGGRVSIGSLRMSNGSATDTITTERRFALEAAKIFLKADTVVMKNRVGIERVYSPSGTIALEADTVQFQNYASATAVVADTMRAQDIGAGRVRTALLEVSGDIEALSGTVRSNEVRTNTITTNNLTTNSTISSPKVITSRITSPDSVIYIGDSSLQFLHAYNNLRASSQTTNSITYRGLGLGNQAYALGWDAVAIGFAVKVASNAYNSIAIGCGPVSAYGDFINDIPNSIMLGTNSTLPTLTIRSANGPGHTDGKVGIGTSTPSGTLEIANSGTRVKFGGGADGIHHLSCTRDFVFNASGVSGSGAAFSFRTLSDFNDLTSYTDLLRITADGNVGIGTTAPQAKLHISGSGDQSIDISTTDHLSSYTRLMAVTSNGVTESQLQFRGLLRFVKPLGYEGGITRMMIDEDGNVGIGCTSPYFLLDVAGTARAQEFHVNLGGCDFVFDNDYSLPSLKERRKKVPEQKHLLHIASAQSMQTDGVGLGELSQGMLQNLEEHELYLYEHDNRIENLEKENKELKTQIEILKEKFSEMQKKAFKK